MSLGIGRIQPLTFEEDPTRPRYRESSSSSWPREMIETTEAAASRLPPPLPPSPSPPTINGRWTARTGSISVSACNLPRRMLMDSLPLSHRRFFGPSKTPLALRRLARQRCDLSSSPRRPGRKRRRNATETAWKFLETLCQWQRRLAARSRSV